MNGAGEREALACWSATTGAKMADTFFLLLLMLLLLLLLWLIGLSDKTTKNIHSHSMKVAMKEQVCVWVKGWGLGGGLYLCTRTRL